MVTGSWILTMLGSDPFDYEWGTESVHGAFDQFDVQIFGEFALSFEELLQGLVVDFVIHKKLLMSQRLMVWQGDGVDFTIVEWILQLHWDECI